MTMGQDEHKRLPPAQDVYVNTWSLQPGMTVDDDNQPLDATVMLDLVGQNEGGVPYPLIRVHLAVETIPTLIERLGHVAAVSERQAEKRRHHRPQG